MSAGYLIAQKSKKELSKLELGVILFSAIVLDFDLFLPDLFGFPAGMHHYFPVHTPMAGIIIWLVMMIFLKDKISKTVKWLSLITIFSHLALDDLSYWISIMGIGDKIRPQIFWAYPFDPRYAGEFEWMVSKRIEEGLTTAKVLKIYLFTVPRLFYLEVILFITAIAVGLRKRYKKKITKGGN